MKTKIATAIAAIALIGFFSVPKVNAEDSTTSAQNHEAHHPEAKTAPTQGEQMPMDGKGEMMGKMDMGEMHSMMQECMKNHKDGKMCNHSMMQKCEEKMGKGECKTMMSQMKKEDKGEKKNK